MIDQYYFPPKILCTYFDVLTGCLTGTFGEMCNELCGNCLNDQPCNNVDGFCRNGCAKGFKWDLCKTGWI